MSEQSSMAGSNASLVASPTRPAPAAAKGVENAANGSVSDSASSSAAAAMQIQQKYAEERNKRVRDDGLSQYVDLARSDNFRHLQEDPWIDTNAPEVGVPALTDGASCKVLIIGAGFGGLTFAVRLIQAGISVSDIRLVDSAGGFGGTWYWNRYPGLMCDIESYIYMPFLEEMEYMPKHKYAYGPELREYAESIAEKFELKDKALFRAEVNDLTWDNNEKEWVVQMEKQRNGQEKTKLTVRARFVIATTGLLNTPKVPASLGIEKFQGHIFHTCRWDYKYTGGSPTDPSLVNLKDKKVGILGTGATAVQAVPHLAKWAKKLYVFQRTPSAIDERGQHATDVQWWDREIRGKKGWQRERNLNFTAFLCNASPPPAINMVADAWTKMPSFSAIIGGPADVSMGSIPAHLGSLHALDLPRQERIRKRVEEIVKDRTTAEDLKAWYPSWCKRPCFHDDYLPSFNLPNVTLVDTDGKGVDGVTENGVVVGGSEYNLDLLILGTGFRAPTIGSSPAYRAGMSVTGRNGLSLDQRWSEGVSTLHGVISRGFPNFFWPGPFQAGATANQAFVLDNLAKHIGYIMAESARKVAQDQQSGERFTIEPTPEAEEEWAMRILSGVATFAGLAGCTPSYLNQEGQNDRLAGQEERMKWARAAIWGKGIADFLGVLEGWRSQANLRGLEVKAAA